MRRIPILLLSGLVVVCLSALGVAFFGPSQLNISGQGSQKPPAVAAASDLKFALEDVAQAFTRQTGMRVRLVFGSSGNLTRQLTDGAPYELFLSADEGFVFKLADAGLTRDRGVLYAVGRLALFAPHGSPLKVDDQLNGLRALAANGGLKRFAIANPAHAPYGRAAEAALRAKDVWDAVQPALVLGDTVAQAAQFATTGNAAGGIIAHSLAVAPPMREAGTFVLLPERDHPPLRQRMVLMNRAGPIAATFYDFMQQSAAREIMSRYGFIVTGAT